MQVNKRQQQQPWHRNTKICAIKKSRPGGHAFLTLRGLLTQKMSIKTSQGDEQQKQELQLCNESRLLSKLTWITYGTIRHQSWSNSSFVLKMSAEPQDWKERKMLHKSCNNWNQFRESWKIFPALKGKEIRFRFLNRRWDLWDPKRRLVYWVWKFNLIEKYLKLVAIKAEAVEKI